MKICKPFRDCYPNSVSQRFGAVQGFNGQKHTGVDITPQNSNSGAILVAPCKVMITNIVDSINLTQDSDKEIRNGYGVFMKPLVGFPPETYFLYWHCKPIFPVKIGEIVEQGFPVAQMSNSGYVMWGGKYVPINQRNAPPYYGTHVHYEYFEIVSGKRNYMDVLPLIDWSIPVTNQGLLEAISRILSKIFNMIR